MIINNFTPAIRFKDFKEEWEAKKLGDIGKTFTGLSGKTKEDFGHGQGRFVTYMNVFSNPISSLEQVEPIEVDNAQHSVRNGDVFFTTSSEIPEEVGMSSIWLGERENVYLNSFCFGFRPISKLDDYYLAYMLRASSFRKKMIFLAQGISRYNISKNRVMEIEVSNPSLNEQIQIGNYFKELDVLIRSHEQKLEKVTNLKKAMLEKMFPKSNEDVPEIRFKAFTEKWKKGNLGDIFDFNIPTNTMSRALLNDSEGQVKNIHYGDILIKYNNCLDANKEKIPFVNNGNIKDFKKCYLKNGDIVFADAAEDEAVGKSIEIFNVGDNHIVSGLHTIVARPILKFQKYFLGYYLNSNIYHLQLIYFMQGTKVLSLSKTSLKKTILAYPSSEKEQQKIGEYFQNLDQLISLSQQKIKQLKNVKQALLQKMFL